MKRTLMLAIALVAATAPLGAQRGNIDHHVSLFMDGSTTGTSSNDMLDNLGGGASFDLRLRSQLLARVTGAYDRVTAGRRSTPTSFTTAAADLVFYPLTETPIRVYAFGGVGYSRQGQSSESVASGPYTTLTQTTSAYSFLGASYGLGLEIAELFIQYRVPPRPHGGTDGPGAYQLISLGLRF